MSNEPVWTVAGITAFCAAVITALIAFGVPLTADQQQALLGLVAVASPLVAAFFSRRRVSPAE